MVNLTPLFNTQNTKGIHLLSTTKQNGVIDFMKEPKDVLDCVKVLSDLLEKKTLSRDKISYQLRQIKTIISNQI
jgi:hypothetical protein